MTYTFGGNNLIITGDVMIDWTTQFEAYAARKSVIEFNNKGGIS